MILAPFFSLALLLLTSIPGPSTALPAIDPKSINTSRFHEVQNGFIQGGGRTSLRAQSLELVRFREGHGTAEINLARRPALTIRY